MKLYLDRQTNQLALTRTSSTEALSIPAKLGTTLELEIFPLQDFTDAVSGQLAAKPKGHYGAAAVAVDLSWTAPSTSDNGYLFEVDLTSAPLAALFGETTDSVVLMADITWVSAGRPSKSQTFAIVVANSISGNGEGTPAAIPDLKATTEQAQDLTDDVHWMTPLKTAEAIAALATSSDALQSFTISSVANNALTARRGINPVRLQLLAGSSPYTATFSLPETAVEGNTIRILALFEASSNQTLSIFNGSTNGSQLFSWTQTGSASVGTLEFIFFEGAWVQLGDNLIFSNTSSGSGGGSGGTSSLPTGAWGYWPLSDFADASGNIHTLNAIGDVSFVPGKIGYAANFNGASVLNVAAPESVLNQFSVSLWASATANGVNFNVGISNNTDEGNACFRLISIGSLVVFQICFESAYVNLNAPSAFILDGSWQHFVATYDGSQMNLYRNDVSLGSLTPPGALNGNYPVGSNFGIGGNGDGTAPCTGMMDEVALYPFALSSNQRSALYNSGTGAMPY